MQAFYLNPGDNKTCPIRDFTMSFTKVSSLDQHMLPWDKLNYIDLRNNRWNCDCHMAWVKGSSLEEEVADHL